MALLYRLCHVLVVHVHLHLQFLMIHDLLSLYQVDSRLVSLQIIRQRIYLALGCLSLFEEFVALQCLNISKFKYTTFASNKSYNFRMNSCC